MYIYNLPTNMAPKNTYSVSIQNQKTGAVTHYTAVNIRGVVDTVNAHYGLLHMITVDVVANLIRRGHDKSPKRFSAIIISKTTQTTQTTQTPRTTHENANSSAHKKESIDVH